MDKNQVISFIKEQIASGKITTDDLVQLSGGDTAPSASAVAPAGVQTSHLTNIFYTIGALIVLVGVVLLFGQHWDEIGFGGRLLVTFGIGLVSYIVGLLLKTPEHNVLSQILITVSAALIPMGVVVYCNEIDIRFTFENQIFISLGLLCVYTVAYFANKRNILILLNIAWGTWLYWVLLLKILGDGYTTVTLLKWALILLGFVYVLIANGLAENGQKERRSMKSLLYFLGTLGVLSGGISIGGAFDLLFILIIFAGFYFSVYIKNTSVLSLSAIFLFVHLIKITMRYFSDWLSWPILLILGGAVVIGIGYFTYFFNKKYIKSV